MIEIVLLLCSVSIEVSHFYGGTMTRKPVDNTDSNACDQSTIVNESPTISGINAHLQCTTTSITSGSYTAISIAEYCTDFSTLVDSNSGRISTVENITTGSTFCVAFQGTAWIGLQSSNCGSSGRKQRKTKPNPGSSGTTTQRITALATTGATCYSAGAGRSMGTSVDLTSRTRWID
ncbi:unnamed protein product [Rotaria magnacalcarata]|uniref:Uncharacterized protein n=1 Tax=Rotaria magnacalcarata TaxID=392030 RepID=A0A816Q0B0_9BILA|nr:unnamed protein product [Rotaria magnacalcarata]